MLTQKSNKRFAADRNQQFLIDKLPHDAVVARQTTLITWLSSSSLHVRFKAVRAPQLMASVRAATLPNVLYV